MKEIINQIKEHEKHHYKTFSGVFLVNQELPTKEFLNLIEVLDNDYNRIGIVDSKLRDVDLKKTNYIVAPSVMDEIGEAISFVNNRVIIGKANLLRALPGYIVIRELISKDNIKDITKLHKVGYNFIAFSDLTKDELKNLYVSDYMTNSENIPLDIVEKIFSHMNICNI